MAKPSGDNRKHRKYKEVIERIRSEGYTIGKEKKHMAVRRPNGSLLFKFGSTPSDSRGAFQTWDSFQKAVRGSE